MTQFNANIKLIETQLSKNLPGLQAQLLMSPSSRHQGIKNLKHDTPPRNSGVLILLYPKNNITHLIFIKRTESGGHHSGQISFPGGKTEQEDKSLIHTALREAEEEVGIIKKDVKILGLLTNLYIPVSNISVLPVVGAINYCPQFIRQPTEVDQILEVPLNNFLEEKNKKNNILKFNKTEIIAPSFMIDEHMIWGATAMMMSEFLEVIKIAGITQHKIIY